MLLFTHNKSDDEAKSKHIRLVRRSWKSKCVKAQEREKENESKGKITGIGFIYRHGCITVDGMRRKF